MWYGHKVQKSHKTRVMTVYVTQCSKMGDYSLQQQCLPGTTSVTQTESKTGISRSHWHNGQNQIHAYALYSCMPVFQLPILRL